MLREIKIARAWLDGSIEEGDVSIELAPIFKDEVRAKLMGVLDELSDACLAELEDAIRLLPGDDDAIRRGLKVPVRARICVELTKKLLAISEFVSDEMQNSLEHLKEKE